MLGGTGSDVGKSVIATGLCRIFRLDGYNPAPFKAQNMALNSFVTPQGGEIGRAQAAQAEACGLAPHTDMNPLLLKPTGGHTSQVVLNGEPIGNRDAYTYFREGPGRDELRREVHAAFDRLACRYNPIVMEGAGSIAEINLMSTDLVNMSMAEYAGAKVILVADIDRGGVFASAYGSIMLQPERYRKLIKGIIVNKFRGDLRLFDKGRELMEQVCGVPVLGVVPFAGEIHIDAEDSVALDTKKHTLSAELVNVAVVRLPHISNFTDFDALERDVRVNLIYTDTPATIESADIIILPGTKSTIADLTTLKHGGLGKAIAAAARKGKKVVGICGGYQMMGRKISDPDGVEGEMREAEGLGLLPVETVLTPAKVLRQQRFRFLDDMRICEGYEIHMGRTENLDPTAQSPVIICEGERAGKTDGCMAGNCLGTYMHGLFDNIAVTDRLLGATSNEVGHNAYKESQYEALASHLRKHIDIEQLYKILSDD